MMNHSWSAKFKNISARLVGGSKPLFIACFLVGFVCGLLFKQKLPIRFKEDLDLLPLIQIVITLIIALLITHYARQKSDEVRAEKAIIIERINAALTQGRNITSAFLLCCDAPEEHSTTEKKQEFIADIRQLSNHLTEIEQLIKLTSYNQLPAELFKNCLDKYFTLRAQITNLDWSSDPGKSGLQRFSDACDVSVARP
ncbi:MAG: hypothetical protein ACREEM_35420 [Blastocatellia bacterium]